MDASSSLAPLPTDGFTTDNANSYPWACVIVFSADGHNSNQHIWLDLQCHIYLMPVFLSRDGGRKVVTRVASAGPEPESEYRLTPGPLGGSETMKAGTRKLGERSVYLSKTNFHCIP